MEYLRVGLIVRPHGVHGDVKFLPLSNGTERFRQLSEAYLEIEGKYIPITVSNVSVQSDAVIARLSGCDSRESAEKLRGTYICVDRAHAVKLDEGEYFVIDLIGCEVLDDAGFDYGKLVDVLETGANDVYVIRGRRSLMVPALKKLLKDVDIPRKRITLDAKVLEEVGLFED